MQSEGDVFDLFLEELGGLEIPEVEIPDFRIPRWPKSAGTVTVNLGRRAYWFPEQSDNSSLLQLQRRITRVTFTILSDGTIYVGLSPWWADSPVELYSTEHKGLRHPTKLERLQVLFLFQQFRGELLPRILRQLREDLPVHEAVEREAREALEPFLPDRERVCTVTPNKAKG